MTANLITAEVTPYGTVGQTLAELLGPGEGWFNVKSFGAVNDGLTDNLAPIEAAIAACLAAGGGAIWFPPGANINERYFISDSITGLAGGSNGRVRLVGVGSAESNYGTYIVGGVSGDTVSITGATTSAEAGYVGCIELTLSDATPFYNDMYGNGYTLTLSTGDQPFGPATRFVVGGTIIGTGGFADLLSGTMGGVQYKDATHIILKGTTMAGAWTSGGTLTLVGYLIDCADHGTGCTLTSLEGINLINSAAAGGGIRWGSAHTGQILNCAISALNVGVCLATNNFCCEVNGSNISCGQPWNPGSVGVLASQNAIRNCTFSAFETQIMAYNVGCLVEGSRWESSWTGLWLGHNFYFREILHGGSVIANSTEQNDTCVLIESVGGLNLSGNSFTGLPSVRTKTVNGYIDDNSTPGTYSGVAGTSFTVDLVVFNYGPATNTILGQKVNPLAYGTVTPGTIISSQISGTPGGAGRYLVDTSQAASFATSAWGMVQNGVLAYYMDGSSEISNEVTAQCQIGAHNYAGASGINNTIIGARNTLVMPTLENDRGGFLFLNCASNYEIQFKYLPDQSDGPAGMPALNGMKYNVSNGTTAGGTGALTMGAIATGGGTQHVEVRFNSTTGNWTVSAL